MKDYLVVGGHGFIGSHLCKRLNVIGSTYDIYDIGEPNGEPSKQVIDKRKEGLPESIEVKDILSQKYRYCIHLGSYAGIRSERNPMDYFRNNNYNLQELFKKICCERFVYISSSSVLGDVETPYSLSKKMAENFVDKMPNSLIIRPFTVYGHNGRPEMLITKMMSGQKMTIYGDPEKIERKFTYVQDLVDCIILNKDRNKTVNSIGVKAYTVADLLEYFGNEYEVTDPDPRDFKKQTTVYGDYNYYCNTRIEDAGLK